jgi:hypothetical protein
MHLETISRHLPAHNELQGCLEYLITRAYFGSKIVGIEVSKLTQLLSGMAEPPHMTQESLFVVRDKCMILKICRCVNKVEVGFATSLIFFRLVEKDHNRACKPIFVVLPHEVP